MKLTRDTCVAVCSEACYCNPTCEDKIYRVTVWNEKIWDGPERTIAYAVAEATRRLMALMDT